MIRTPFCRTCVALGFLVSALVHGLAAALMLRMDAAPTPVPEMQAIELNLAMFGPLTQPDDDRPPAQAEPAPPPPPEPEPISKPPEPEPVPIAEPAPLPEAAPQPPPKLRSRPPPREKPKPKPKPKPEKRPVPRPKAQPIPAPESRLERREPKARTEPGPSRPSPETSAKSSPATAPGAKASGSPAASPRGGPSPAVRASAERAYLAELQRAIARHQRFPEDARRRKATGVATLAFVVHADGRIGQVRVVKSSGDAALDQAAVSALARLGRFKPIPASIGRSSWPMRVPIRFDLR